MARVLGLFAKEPRPGQVKTRLAAATSPEWAASVAEAFLRDVVQRLTNVAVRRVLAFAPATAHAYFAELVQGQFALTPPWYDVDTLDDWQVLRGHLAGLRRAGHALDTPRTLALTDLP